jgi:hypothetical protein
MTLVPLDIPAGFYRNGTDLEQTGRWRDGSLVRWRDNSLRPVKGWQTRKASFASNTLRGMHSWEANDGIAYIAGGSYNELKLMNGGGTLTNITPSNLNNLSARRVPELERGVVITGYGYGDYGENEYGTARPNDGNFDEATTWSIDNWGEDLIACSSSDGRIWYWDKSANASTASVLTNAPTKNLGLVVTEERFIFALGAGDDPRKVQWCDREANTVWTPATTNEAGDILLQTSGQIMQGIRTRGQTLIITDVDAHAMRYLGPPYVYSNQRVGTACGAISRKAAADVDAGVFWMGQRGFHHFDGNSVRELPCDVHDYVFDDFNRGQQSQVWAWANTEYKEIWWFYCSAGSTDIDKYVAFDYQENHWVIGNLGRSSGVGRGVFKLALLAGNNKTLYEHEVGHAYDSQSVFAETGPISLGNGDNIMNVMQLIPDEATQGQVQVKFKTRFYPNGSEQEHGPYAPANPTGVRFSGRQMRMRVEGVANTDWRVGNMRVDALPAGKR